MKSPAIKSWSWPALADRTYLINITPSSRAKHSKNLVAVAHWYDTESPATSATGEHASGSIKSVYLEPEQRGWSGRLTSPKNAKLLRVSLYHWHQIQPLQRLARYNVRLEEVPGQTRRTVTLAVAYQCHPKFTTWAANMKSTLGIIAQAGEKGVDLLCLSETFLECGIRRKKDEYTYSLNAKPLQPLYAAARRANLHLIFSLKEKLKGRIYNTAVLVSPEGKSIGTYRKSHLTFSEIANGICPGNELPVFDTAIGKIGILICWDGWFPESATILARKGAEIICYPIAGDGNPTHWEHVWRARAIDNQVFWLSSVTGNSGGNAPSRILSPAGKILAQTRKPNGLAKVMVTLPSVTETHWLSFPDCTTEWSNVMRHSSRPILKKLNRE